MLAGMKASLSHNYENILVVAAVSHGVQHQYHFARTKAYDGDSARLYCVLVAPIPYHQAGKPRILGPVKLPASCM